MMPFNSFFNKVKNNKVLALFSFSSSSYTLANIIAGLIIVKFISPKDLGLWNSFQILITYSVFFQAGIINGLSRELPFYLGKNKNDEAHKLAGTSLFCTKISIILISLIGMIFIAFYLIPDIKSSITAFTILLLSISTFYNNYLIVTFRSKNSFIKLSHINFIGFFLSLATIPILYFYGYFGLLFRSLLISYVLVFFMHLYRPLVIKETFQKKSFSKLFKTGTPIFLLDYLKNSASTFDKVCLLYFTDLEHIGFYAIAGIVFRTFTVIPKSISQYFYPRMTFKYGETNDPILIWRMSLHQVLINLCILIPIGIFCYLILPFSIKTFAPQYVPGIQVAQISIISAIFAGAAKSISVIWSMKIWRLMIIYQLTHSLLFITCPLFFAFFLESKLLGVALGVMLVYVSTFIFGLYLIYLATHSLKYNQHKP